jgi:hypothetical protein
MFFLSHDPGDVELSEIAEQRYEAFSALDDATPSLSKRLAI